MLRRRRLFQDEVFSLQQWQRHTTWRRFLPELIVFTRLVRHLFWPTVIVCTLATLVCIYHSLLEPAGAPRIAHTAPLLPFQLTSFALALLLVFRTEASFSRWLEARQVWSTMILIPRNVVREALTWHTSNAEAANLLPVLQRWAKILPLLCKCHIQENRDLAVELQSKVSPHEAVWLTSCAHPPNNAAQLLTDLVTHLQLSEYHQVAIDNMIKEYVNGVGACERISKTPLPLAYTRHTIRFLMTWLCTLPISAWPSCGWFTIPVVGCIAFLLLGIENIAVQIENPFGVLPLDDFCAREMLPAGCLTRTGGHCNLKFGAVLPLPIHAPAALYRPSGCATTVDELVILSSQTLPSS